MTGAARAAAAEVAFKLWPNVEPERRPLRSDAVETIAHALEAYAQAREAAAYQRGAEAMRAAVLALPHQPFWGGMWFDAAAVAALPGPNVPNISRLPEP